MKTRSERFHEALASISDEELAAIDAKLDDPNYQPPEVEWRDDPDPFGMDWKWLSESVRESPRSTEADGATDAPSADPAEMPRAQPPPILTFFRPADPIAARRWLPIGVGVSIAASEAIRELFPVFSGI